MNKKFKFLIGGTLVLFVFLMGCAVIEKEPNETEQNNLTDTDNSTFKEVLYDCTVNETYTFIKNGLDSVDRSCNSDDDCIVKNVGCIFGCSVVVNENESNNKIFQEAVDFSKTCYVRCKCRVLEPSCAGNICVGG